MDPAQKTEGLVGARCGGVGVQRGLLLLLLVHWELKWTQHETTDLSTVFLSLECWRSLQSDLFSTSMLGERIARESMGQ